MEATNKGVVAMGLEREHQGLRGKFRLAHCVTSPPFSIESQGAAKANLAAAQQFNQSMLHL
jgi:hypothetical protein